MQALPYIAAASSSRPAAEQPGKAAGSGGMGWEAASRHWHARQEGNRASSVTQSASMYTGRPSSDPPSRRQ